MEEFAQNFTNETHRSTLPASFLNSICLGFYRSIIYPANFDSDYRIIHTHDVYIEKRKTSFTILAALIKYYVNRSLFPVRTANDQNPRSFRHGILVYLVLDRHTIRDATPKRILLPDVIIDCHRSCLNFQLIGSRFEGFRESRQGGWPSSKIRHLVDLTRISERDPSASVQGLRLGTFPRDSLPKLGRTRANC